MNVTFNVHQESMPTVTAAFQMLLLAMTELQIRTGEHPQIMSVTVLTDIPLLSLLTGSDLRLTQPALMKTNVLVPFTIVVSTLTVNAFVKMATHTTQKPNHDSTTVSTLRH